MAGDYDNVVRGSVILEWSPSGVLRRYVVRRPHVFLKGLITGRPLAGDCLGHELIECFEDGSLGVGSKYLTKADVEQHEGFGGSFVYMLGEVHPIPEEADYGTRRR